MYFSISDFLDSGRKSLNDNNYYSALSVALALPSMCSRVEYGKNRGYYRTYDNGKIRWHDRKSYVDFCNAHLSRNCWLFDCFGHNIGDVLYCLRCDIVHAGCANIYDGDFAVWLSFSEDMPTTTFSKYKIVSVRGICRSIFDTLSSWISTSGAENYQYTHVFSDDGDDRLLYERLCDKERADYLEEKFLEELAKREENKM